MTVQNRQSILPKLIRYGSVLLLGFLMALLHQLTGMHEFVFPEGISVVLGVWGAQKQPWRVSKIQLFFMMIVGAVCAVCIIRYIPIPHIFQIMIGFALVGITLIVTRSSFAPVVSAFMLPIIMKTDSWLFPIIVCCYMVIIVSVQTLFQRIGLTEKPKDLPIPFHWKKEFIHWGILFAIFSVLVIYPALTHSIYLIVPPLIITFVEMAETSSHARNHPIKAFVIMALAPWFGTGWHFLSIYTAVPSYVTIPLAIVTLIILMEVLHFSFAGSGSLVILPLLFHSDTLIWYPVQAMIGLVFFLVIPLILFHNHKSPPRQKNSIHQVHTTTSNETQYSN